MLAVSIAKVLVVDDYSANRVAIEAVLAPLGHEIVMASSGEEAIRQLLHQDFALVLLDLDRSLGIVLARIGIRDRHQGCRVGGEEARAQVSQESAR
jgi:CheY-like chemotaxis protein